MIQCWMVDRRVQQDISVVEMRMLRWIRGMTREDRIRHEYVSGIVVALIVIKTKKNRLRWFGYIYIQ